MGNKRKYKEQTVLRLMVASAGRCTLCNNDLMNEWFSHTKVNTAEKAHIIAFSNLGPRSDCTKTCEEKNSEDNLIILCASCHKIIDEKSTERLFTTDTLKLQKRKKEEQIQSAIKNLLPNYCVIVKYGSAIGETNFTIRDEDLYEKTFNAGYYSETKTIVNMNEDNNFEDVSVSINVINQNFVNRIQPLINNNEHKTICLFSLAPQPLLIYLGTKFSDKLDVKVFTKHRDHWIYNDSQKKELISFNIKKPKTCNLNNRVVLCLNCTNFATPERLEKAFGKNIDIWKLESTSFGIDLISTQIELKDFHKKSIRVLDKIGNVYGKNKEIDVLPIVCNSLAVTFGRAIMRKSHNKINIYDTKKDNKTGEITDTFTISI